jgi:hypothetical protein
MRTQSVEGATGPVVATAAVLPAGNRFRNVRAVEAHYAY